MSRPPLHSALAIGALLALLLAPATHAQTLPGPTPTPGPLVVQSKVDQTTATGAHLLLTLTNPLPPSGAALSLDVPVQITVNYTIAGDTATQYQAASNLASFVIPASDNTMTFSPCKFTLPPTMSLAMDSSVPQATYALINLMDGSTQVTMTPAPLDGGQTQTWGWTVSRRK